MRDDDDALANIDLSAWEPPAPPASLVDDVIERAAAMPVLVEPVTRPPVQRRRAKRWWIAGGIAAAVAAVAAIGLWGIERAPSHTSTTVVSDTANGKDATLDAKAEIQQLREKLDRMQHEIDTAGGPRPVPAPTDDVALAEAKLRRAQVILANERRLFAAQASTQGDVDRAQADVAIAKIALERARLLARPRVEDPKKQQQLADEERAAREAAEKRLREEKTKGPPTAGSCDEVSCVLTGDDAPCCAKYLRKPTRAEKDKVAVAQAEAEVRIAQIEFLRTKKLWERQTVTNADLARARAALDAAEAKLRAARARMTPDAAPR